VGSNAERRAIGDQAGVDMTGPPDGASGPAAEPAAEAGADRTLSARR